MSRRFWRKLSSLFRRGRFDRELEAEIQFHIETRTLENVAGGATPEQGRREALRRFGNRTLAREQARDVWALRRLEELLQDLRHGARLLGRSPGFAAVAVLSLALGIGANTALFTLMDAVLWKELPVRDPEQLVQVEPAPYTLFREARDGNEVFSGALTASADGLSLTAEGTTERIMGEAVSGNYFSLLGVPAFLGRTFGAEIERGGWAPEAVLSHDYWKRRFGGSRAVLGASIQLNGYPFTVVGISPPGFFGLEVGMSPEVRVAELPESLAHTMPAMPLLDPPTTDRFVPVLMARLRPEVAVERATAASDVAYQRFLRENPKIAENPRFFFRGSHVRLRSGARGTSLLRDRFERPLFILMGVVGVVLVITCANIAGLLLSRATVRRREIALRAAIGATRARIVRQLFTESLLISILGGALGIVLALWGAGALFAFVPQTHLRFVLDLELDFRVLGFTLSLAVAAGILFGVGPALSAVRSDLAPALKPGAAEAGRRRFGPQKALAISQVALSLVLLVGAGLFVRTLQNLKAARAGFDAESVFLFTMKHVHERYTAAQIRTFCRELIERVELLPGVRAAALSETGPFSQRENPTRIAAVDDAGAAGETVEGFRDRVSPGFFESLGVALLQGRDFAFGDPQAARSTAVINEVAARRLFAGRSPLGRQIEMRRGPRVERFEVAGVVGSVKHASLRRDPPAIAYLSILEGDKPWMPTLYVRASGNPNAVVAGVRREFQTLDRDLPVFNVKTLSRQVDESMAREHLIATLSGFFGLLAAVLASIGVYGVMAYGVAQRTREIGVRVALGADRSGVLRLILKETFSLAAAGVLIGLAAALALTRTVTSLLFGLEPTDMWTLSAAAGLMLGVAGLAGFLPARRAARVDPMVALRHG